MRKLTNSMFFCHWHRQNMKFRRSLIILMQITQKPEPLLAGNIVPVSLETFTNVSLIVVRVYFYWIITFDFLSDT